MNIIRWFRNCRLRKRERRRLRKLAWWERSVDGSRRSVLPFTGFAAVAAATGGAALFRSTPAEANTAFTSFAYQATGSTASQTTPDRFGQICFNVKDFGAVGNGVADDTGPIRNAIAAMYALTTKSCILYFPAGSYKVTDTIDIGNNNVGANNTSGIIRGAGRFATSIGGKVDTGFIFSQIDGVNGPEEISNMNIGNVSTVIGTGALLINNSSMRITQCNFGGMIGVMMPNNIFEVKIENCSGNAFSDVTTGYTGTFGIAGFACNIIGWRTSSPYQAAIQLDGSNPSTVVGSSSENCTVAYVAGMATGWGQSCTTATGTNSAILTVGAITTGETQFSVGGEIFMKGVTTVADWPIMPLDPSMVTITSRGGWTFAISSYTYNSGTGLVTLTMANPVVINPGDSISTSGLNIAGLNVTANTITATGTTITYTGPTGQAGSPTGGGTLTDNGVTGTGGAGTYRISRNVTQASAVPCVSRRVNVLSGSKWVGLSSEGCRCVLFVASVATCSFDSIGGSATINECVDAFGTVGFTATYGFYLSRGVATFTNCQPTNNAYVASWAFDPVNSNQFTLINCVGQKLEPFVTGTSSSISNGLGGSGTILNVVSGSGGAVNVGMPVTGPGVSANTVIIGNHTTDNTLSGIGGLGTYRVNNLQNITSTALTIGNAVDWQIPTADFAKTGIQMVNCNSSNLASTSSLLNGLQRTYASLPGNSGSNPNFPVQDGMEYDIVDGLAAQCTDTSCTNFGTNVNGGGGALHLRVRYNAAAGKWRLVGM